ncbi:uncharacterized protein LOC135840023 [Planococcus citri]|uniref:uncharacterized protein LOC135840023 n=1 Tax=Planococcus citri TaxID=170843 RepID=UPI0031F91F3F
MDYSVSLFSFIIEIIQPSGIFVIGTSSKRVSYNNLVSIFNMKFIVFAAVFGSALVFAAASPAADTFEQQVQKKQEAAAKQCNATYPVTEDSLNKLRTHVATGETVTTTLHYKWCNLLCILEQIGFYDAQGRVQVGKIYNYTLKAFPEIEPNKHSFLIYLFQIARSTHHVEDKCQKAYIVYYRFVEAVLIHTLAVDLETFDAATKEKIAQSVLTGDVLPSELQGTIAKWLKTNDSVIKQVAE